ncbi:MAG TPA: PPC domain-containing protein [Blastocatellia bacterium]|nr:PPC domain-containing protein [Blastocatellia bacterium]
MRMRYHRRFSGVLAAMLLAANLTPAQDSQAPLKIGRTGTADRQNNRTTPVAELDRDSAFKRVFPDASTNGAGKSLRAARNQSKRVSKFETLRVVSAPQSQSLGTGGGDINEIEPNDPVAQGVSLPVNIFGVVRLAGDVDFFSFQALAGEQITVEPFAARLPRSKLVADIALFDASGSLLASDVGDENNDPLIRFTSPTDQVLIAGITDADNLGTSRFDYLLNITRGIDLAEQEPNDSTAQHLSDLPITMFGSVGQRGDVDFYSFEANAGQTLILDLDAEVLGSGLDAEMNLTDPATGIEYFYNDQYDGNDPRFNIVLPLTGRYVIGIGAVANNSTGFYRLNASLVSGAGAPVLATVTRLTKKLIEVTGAGFTDRSVVEVNGSARRTTFVGSGTLRAKVKAKAGNVVTVSNAPDDRRSNPLLVR